jgi:hypothetical protein
MKIIENIENGMNDIDYLIRIYQMSAINCIMNPLRLSETVIFDEKPRSEKVCKM